MQEQQGLKANIPGSQHALRVLSSPPLWSSIHSTQSTMPAMCKVLAVEGTRFSFPKVTCLSPLLPSNLPWLRDEVDHGFTAIVGRVHMGITNIYRRLQGRHCYQRTA